MPRYQSKGVPLPEKEVMVSQEFISSLGDFTVLSGHMICKVNNLRPFLEDDHFLCTLEK